MRYFRITPLDTFFFRDGSPFDGGETGQMEVRGIFPPSPTTVAGSLRAAFARQLGWRETRRGEGWNATIIEKLGNGDDLEPLSFSGLYLARNEEIVFPAPLHLLRAGEHLSRLKPGDDELLTDIGPVCMPEVEKKHDEDGREIKGFKTLEGAYLTPGAMSDALNWEEPHKDGIIPATCLWKSEARVGIQRNRVTRTTEEEALYQTIHARLRRDVGLIMGVGGYDGPAPATSTLGGESRMVGMEPYKDFTLPEPPGLEPSNGKLCYIVTLITPARLPDDGWREPGGTPGGLPGSVVSACVGKPVMIGGWDSVNRCPKPLEPHLPAGSTWFMEAPEHKKKEVLKLHGKYIGKRTEWGYGQILIGAWR